LYPNASNLAACCPDCAKSPIIPPSIFIIVS
jgi:TRAP-type C4-dicarboxylate transport system permease large subunit